MIYKGNPVSAGIAIGSAFVYDPKILTAPEDAPVLPMECELERYENAVQAAQAKLREIQAAFTGKDDDKAEIFSAHLDMVDDEEISEEIRSAIHAGTGAAKAVEQVYQRYADLLAALDDDFMVQRAHDLLDVQQRLLRILLGALEQNLSRLDGPVIVICDDLMPSDTATMDRANVLGIVAQKGGYTSHSAIIARGWGIPAVLGIPDIMSCVSSGDTIVLDAIAGNLHSEPTPQELQNAAAQQTMFMEQKSISDKFLYAPGRTLDGVPVEIGLNMGKPAPEVLETSTATDYVGLLRTEFLYMESDHMPTEEEQFAAYKKVLLEYGERPVTLRTLDIGGDKSLPYFALPREDNPFLGIRALRLCFENEDIMRTQLRAALRASVYLNLSDLHPFKNHLFGVRDDAEMQGLVESVKAAGVNQPALVRPREDGGYEIIAGHRRQRASELAGFANMPCIVRNMTDDEAILAMTDDNLRHRERILPTEKAQSLKMQVEAIKHQGSRPGEEDKDAGKRSTQVVGDRNGMNYKQVQRYIRLTELVPDLQKMVDEKKLAFTPAVEISFIRPKNQRYIAVSIEGQQSSPSLSQAQKMRELDKDGKLNGDVIDGTRRPPTITPYSSAEMKAAYRDTPTSAAQPGTSGLM